MSAHDHLPAHLVPLEPAQDGPRPSGDVVYSEAGRWDGKPLTIGTPPSPETRLEPPPIVTIRQAGERGSELYVCTSSGTRLVVPLSWGHLSNLAADAVAAMIRMAEETPTCPPSP